MIFDEFLEMFHYGPYCLDITTEKLAKVSTQVVIWLHGIFLAIIYAYRLLYSFKFWAHLIFSCLHRMTAK